MKTETYFSIGKNDITWIGNNFQEWFGDMTFIMPKKAVIVFKVLNKSMNDQSILAKLKPEEVDLGFVLYCMKKSKDMLKNGWANIFYVRDVNNVLRAVRVDWSVDGWGVDACEVTSPYAWFGDVQVFSRKFLIPSESETLGHSDTLTLRVQSLEGQMDSLRKIVNF